MLLVSRPTRVLQSNYVSKGSVLKGLKIGQIRAQLTHVIISDSKVILQKVVKRTWKIMNDKKLIILFDS